MAYQLIKFLYEYSQKTDLQLTRESNKALRANYLGFPLPWLKPEASARIDDAKPMPIGQAKPIIRLAYGSVIDEAIFHLARFLETATTVESLDLQFNEVTDIGVTDLAVALRINRRHFRCEFSS